MGLRRLRDNMKWSNIHIIWVPEGKNLKMVLKIYSKIMTETWWKTHTWVFRKLNTQLKEIMPRQKLLKSKEKEKIMKSVRKKRHLQGNTNLDDSRFLIWKPWQPERSGIMFSSPERKELSTWILYLGELCWGMKDK